MRLMEVDEAANHIRELVDPDANIIWGSAFNDGLNGKIRVSVVATGIDSEATAGAAPLTQPFSFANRPAVAVPAAAASRQTPPPAPAPVAAPEPEPETLELDVPAAPEPAPIAAPIEEKAAAPKPAPAAPARPAAIFSDEDSSQDELLLGAEAAESQPVPAPAPQAAPRVATGGTLFERMAGLTRGADNAAARDDAGSPPDIPRFLNRQSNQ
jgi:cell division protein FtsZ